MYTPRAIESVAWSREGKGTEGGKGEGSASKIFGLPSLPLPGRGREGREGAQIFY